MNYRVAAKIIEHLVKNTDFLPITTLSKQIKEPFTTTFKTVKTLEKEDIILLKSAGKSKIVFLKKNPKIIGILAGARALKINSKESFFREIEAIYDKIPQKMVI